MRTTVGRAWGAVGLGLLAALLAGCGSTGPKLGGGKSLDAEAFEATNTHTRIYDATVGQTCEAARRALLSQGYMIAAAAAEQVTGRKSFQPEGEVHVEVEFRVVCAREEGESGNPAAIAFATAVQDRYGLKKVNNSASVGVGAFGSLSLPFSSSNDAMVKVASETLSDERFYDRFYALLERYLDRTDPAVATPVTGGPAPANR